jgi:hypothetical protein
MQYKTLNQMRAAQLNERIFADLVGGLARSVALTVEVFLHSGFGAGYIGCGFMGVVVMFVFTLCFPDQNPLPVLWFSVAYGVLWLVAAIKTLARYWSGRDRVHSKYTGRPHLWRLLPDWKEDNIKKLEALAVILVGWGVHYFSRELGNYLMLAALLVFLRVHNIVVQQRSRVVEMNDAVIEQKLIADRFREIQQR